MVDLPETAPGGKMTLELAFTQSEPPSHVQINVLRPILSPRIFRLATLALCLERQSDAESRHHAAWCSPRRKFSTRYSEVRSEKVRMLIVVVLSVQFRKTLASQTYRFDTSCV